MEPSLKKEILQSIIGHLSKEIDSYHSITKKEKDFANNNEMKQEGKYDTRKVEAGYLASAQLRRLEELNIHLNKYQSFKPIDHSAYEHIRLGSLIQCLHEKKVFYYFLSPISGGLQLKNGEVQVKVISSLSPIGKKVIGLGRSDSFELVLKKEKKLFSIIEFI